MDNIDRIHSIDFADAAVLVDHLNREHGWTIPMDKALPGALPEWRVRELQRQHLDQHPSRVVFPRVR